VQVQQHFGYAIATTRHAHIDELSVSHYTHSKKIETDHDVIDDQTVELKVRMCCSGCERVVKHALTKLRGVDSVEVDVALEKVTVTGYVERHRVLKEVRRAGKKAEFWPNPGLPLHFTTAKNYFHDEESYRRSYNYYRHGYNGDKHGRLPEPQRGADPVANLFNDDDVNACSVM
jgi:copper chaperone CopZ